MWRALRTEKLGFASAMLAAAFVLASPAASAQPKLEIGFRSGYALPLGNLYERGESPEDVDDLAIGQVPIWFDIGARIGKNLFVGGYFSYGVVVLSGALKRECDELERLGEIAYVYDAKGDCSFHDLRVGAEAQLHLGKPGLLLDPWVGGGVGYEWLSLGMFYEIDSPYGQNGNLSETLHGFEFLNLQSGLDFRMSDTTTFGPFLAFTVSTYRIARSSCRGSCEPFNHGFEYVADEAFHHWFFFGVRGSFLL